MTKENNMLIDYWQSIDVAIIKILKATFPSFLYSAESSQEFESVQDRN